MVTRMPIRPTGMFNQLSISSIGETNVRKLIPSCISKNTVILTDHSGILGLSRDYEPKCITNVHARSLNSFL